MAAGLMVARVSELVQPSPTLSVFVPAYQAAGTLRNVIERIPDEAWRIITAVHIINDGSTDDTEAVARALEQEHDVVHVCSQRFNQGYGATVRQGMRQCLASNADYVACLHADGQYPPEQLYPFVQHMRAANIDVLQGSRHKTGTALAGGMPRYKYAAGKVLTWLENAAFGLTMTDYHSGFLVYSRKAIQTVPIERLSGYFDYDLEFIVCALAKGLTIDELAIATHYGDEISHLNPVRYGLHVLGVIWKYVTGGYSRL
jgi:glycosyltransferase involved in cell wall biosynthesis